MSNVLEGLRTGVAGPLHGGSEISSNEDRGASSEVRGVDPLAGPTCDPITRLQAPTMTTRLVAINSTGTHHRTTWWPQSHDHCRASLIAETAMRAQASLKRNGSETFFFEPHHEAAHREGETMEDLIFCVRYSIFLVPK